MSYKYAKEIFLHQTATVLLGGTREGNWYTEIFTQTNVRNRPTTRSKDRNRNLFLTWYFLPNWHMNTLLSLDFFLFYALSSIRHYNPWKSFIRYKKKMPSVVLFTCDNHQDRLKNVLLFYIHYSLMKLIAPTIF